MKIQKLKLENFRGFETETVINFNNLTVFVGKNDIGKSTILEALDIFLNENKGVVKIDQDDVNKHCLNNGKTEVKISVVFNELPHSLTIDSLNPTSLKDEYLLCSDGTLEIVKKYNNGGGREKVYVKAYHPTNPQCNDLLLKKNSELKQMLTHEMQCNDKTKNAEIRNAIWSFYNTNLQLADIEIELSKLDAKDTWEQLKKYLPLYSLFQSDRKNSDGDSEIQNPMKFAVQEILNDPKLKGSLDSIALEVENKLTEVAEKTLDKLKEMNPDIAKSLNPVIPKPESLKWSDVFKNVNIYGDEDIPINKRGSGVKRLVLLNFFRAEAERKQMAQSAQTVIYGIEEPETSQHPEHQRKLIDAFKALSKSLNAQIILTTHSPAIVKLMDFDNLQLVKNGISCKEVIKVEKGNLPYPSLNEVNYLAFDESSEEYHNELYGYIDAKKQLQNYIKGKPKMNYRQLNLDGSLVDKQKTLTEYIRHQIHHPENSNNPRYTFDQLQQSIGEMRAFIKTIS